MMHARSAMLGPTASQRGAASLTVVMVLFLIVSLVAAYTSRNLIFEQRTAANQYRSTQAFEAAEAGLEWALAMLNSGRIDASCGAGTAADTSFRDRYLAIDPDSGSVSRRVQTGGGELWPSCVFDGAAWRCSCPVDGSPAVAAPAGDGVFPAFRLRFLNEAGAPPGVIRVEVNGCTRLDNACLDFPAQAVASEGRATVSALVALRNALRAPPLAALTTRGALTVGAPATLTVVNSDLEAGGVTVRTGAPAVVITPGADLRAVSVPGTPGSASVVTDDPALNAIGTAPPVLPLAEDRLFAQIFAVPRATYLAQPATIGLDCPVGGCSADQVRNLIALNPGRIVHVRGDLVVADGDIGSAAAPVLLIVDGSLDLASSTSRIFGLVYAQHTDLALAGNGELHGALVAQGNAGGAASVTLVYDAAVLKRLRLAHGSFVRVPGSWRDFQ